MAADIHALMEDADENDCAGLLERRAPVHLFEEHTEVKRLRLTRGLTRFNGSLDGRKAINVRAQQCERSLDDLGLRSVVAGGDPRFMAS
jgi:hypothetical protein